MSTTNLSEESKENTDNKQIEELVKVNPDIENKNISYEIGYIVPFWSSYPHHPYELDLWREGTIIKSIDISKKEYYIIGRNKEACDISIGDMTVSRFHCVLQHKDDGEVFLYDLDSVYGTFINKKPIPKKAYTKLSVGDTFVLGKSKRMFILNGPNFSKLEEIEGEGEQQSIPLPKYVDRKVLMEKRINQIKEQHERKLEYQKTLIKNDEFNWGMKDYDDDIRAFEKQELEEEKEREKNPDSYLGKLDLEEIRNRKDLSDKQRNTVDKMDGLMTRIEKLKEEIIKMRKKEMEIGELSEGQLNRIKGNEKRLQELMEKYEVQEENLRVSLSSKDGVNLYNEQKFDKEALRELNSDDDEFFDRTKTKVKELNEVAQTGPITENYETLKQKLENLIRIRQKILDKSQKLNTSLNDHNDEGDTLENYMDQNYTELNLNVKSKLLQQVGEMTKEIQKTQKLISLVTPSFIKIKYNPNESIVEHGIPSNFNKITKDSENSDDNEDNTNTFVRDNDTLNSERKKYKNSVNEKFDQFNKMRSKLQKNKTGVKYTDSDEEIINEVEMYKEQIGAEIKDSLVDKREAFLKNVAQQQKLNNQKDSEFNKVESGLIKKKEATGEKSYFNEIVGNIGTTYDPEKYGELNKLMSQKVEEKKDNKINKNIDYSTGGLQTFQNDTDPNQNEIQKFSNYDDREVDLEDEDEFISKKRNRIVIEPKSKILIQPKQYSAMRRPPNRNDYDYNEDPYDYDSTNIPGDNKFSEYHDLSLKKTVNDSKRKNLYEY